MALVERVVINPVTVGGRRFEPDRVDVVWRA
jgi:hypothetical protein